MNTLRTEHIFAAVTRWNLPTWSKGYPPRMQAQPNRGQVSHAPESRKSLGAIRHREPMDFLIYLGPREVTPAVPASKTGEKRTGMSL